MTKLIITMITFLFTSNINAKILYKIPLKNENNIVINNNLPNNDNSIGESAIDENPNSEEGINEWAVFLQNNSNYYGGNFGPMIEPANTFSAQEEDFCENEMECECIDCGFPSPERMSLEEIEQIIKTPNADISVDGYSYENTVVFPTQLGLNNTIKSLRFEPVVKNISGMDNVQVIQENFRVDFAEISSYESLSNLKYVGEGIEIYGSLYNELISDMSFLRNLEYSNHIWLVGMNPINIHKINKNLQTNAFVVRSDYFMEEEDAYWIRDRIREGKIGAIALESLSNNDLKQFEGLTHIDKVHIKRLPNLTNFESMKSLTTIGNVEINYNSSLMDLDGFNNLTRADYLEIRYNENLTSTKGLESLTTAGVLNLSSNSLTDLTGLKNLVSVDYLGLSHNDLPNLDGLENLVTVNNELYIERNFNLKNLNGLKNLERLGTLDLYNTPVEDISGLAGLTNVTGLVIFQEREGGFLVKLSNDSYLCKNISKVRMYTLDGGSWNKNEICE